MDNLEEMIRRIPLRKVPDGLDRRMAALCECAATANVGRRGIRHLVLAGTAAAAMLIGAVVGFHWGRRTVPAVPPQRDDGKALTICRVELVPVDSAAARPFVFTSPNRRCAVPESTIEVTVNTGEGL